MIRQFELRAPSPVEGVFLRAAVGTSVHQTEDGFEVAGFGRIHAAGDLGDAVIRGEEGARELLFPVQFQAGDGAVSRCEVRVQW